MFGARTGQKEKTANDIKDAFSDEVTHLQLTVETFFRKQGKVKKEVRLAFPRYIDNAAQATPYRSDIFVQARACGYPSAKRNPEARISQHYGNLYTLGRPATPDGSQYESAGRNGKSEARSGENDEFISILSVPERQK